MLDIILDLIYPPVCGICGKLDKNFLCKKCENVLKKQAAFENDNYEDDIQKNYDEHLYMFLYDGIIRNCLLNYKFRDKSYLYKTFITFLLKNEIFVEKIKSYDIIIAVPISIKRKKMRGYNQSGLIAREIGKCTNIKLLTNCLYKNKDTVPQSSLSKEKRIKNVEGVFALRNIKEINNKKVLIVDDIYTTGNTVNECSRLLKEAGAIKIAVFTLAKD